MSPSTDRTGRPASSDSQSASPGPATPEGAPPFLTGPFASRTEQHQLFEALDGWASVIPMFQLKLLPSATRRIAPCAVILPLDAPAGNDVASAIRRVRQVRPGTPIICCATLRPGLGAAICDVVRAGATHLLWLGAGPRRTRDALHAILDAPGAPPDALA